VTAAPVADADLNAAAAASTSAIDYLDFVDQPTRELIERRRNGTVHRRGWLVRRALALADVVGLALAFVLSQLLYGGSGAADQVSPYLETIAFFATLPLWVVLTRLYGLYDRDEEVANHSSVDDLFGVFNLVTVGTSVFYTVSALTGLAHPSPQRLVAFWAIAVVAVSAGRTLARAVCRRGDSYIQNTLIVGAGHIGQTVARKLVQHPEYGVNVLGFVDEHPRARGADLRDLAVIGEVADLPAIVRELDVERVIVAFSRHPHGKTLELIRTLNHLDVQVDIVPRLFEVVGPSVRVHSAEGLPLLGLPPPRLPRSSFFLKRTADVVLSALGLIVLTPVFVVIATAIRLDSPGPVIFRQTRVGRRDKPFRIAKFRTMRFDADERKHEVAHLNKHEGSDPRMFKIEGDPRVTRVGAVLRHYSLDELPQLLNVLVGQMSLVGPRPLIVEEARHVDGWGRRRLDLRPGITGLWQTLGRDDIPFGEMLGLDYQYVTSWSLSGDLKLIARTIPALAGSGAGDTHRSQERTGA
jgi:exopolysaccharide biosynthesis polyprenyl glycosylphosphotransferase